MFVCCCWFDVVLVVCLCLLLSLIVFAGVGVIDVVAVVCDFVVLY